jgi:hypothetical protein
MCLDIWLSLGDFLIDASMRIAFRFRLFAFLLAPVLLVGCAAKLDVPVPTPGRADFSRTIAMGGTALSGYQDGALTAETQAQSIPALVAGKLAEAGAGDFGQALMASGYSVGLNHYPWVSPYQTKSHLGDATDCNGDVSLGPLKNTLLEADLAGTPVWTKHVGAIQDFTVPFSGMWDLDRRNLGDDHLMGGPSVYASRFPFAGNNRSILEEAIAANPTFVIWWPGMDEVWNWASKGGSAPALPSPGIFRAKLDSVLTALTATGAKGVLATIPDIANMPFFTTIPPRALTLDDSLADALNGLYNSGGIFLNFVNGENGFVVEDSMSTYGIRQLTNDDMILLSVPLDSMKCYKMGVLFRLIPDRCSLLASELQAMRNTVAQYNSAIRDLAATHDFAVAETEQLYQKLKTGIRFDAADFTTEFAAGGFFSLDGFGPNPKGCGLIANEFIAAINAHYSALVPMVQIADLNGVLFP